MWPVGTLGVVASGIAWRSWISFPLDGPGSCAHNSRKENACMRNPRSSRVSFTRICVSGSRSHKTVPHKTCVSEWSHVRPSIQRSTWKCPVSSRRFYSLNSAYFATQKQTLSDGFANGSVREAQERQTFCVRVSLCAQYVLSLSVTSSQFATDPPHRSFVLNRSSRKASVPNCLQRSPDNFILSCEKPSVYPTKTGCIGRVFISRSSRRLTLALRTGWLPACRKYSR